VEAPDHCERNFKFIRHNRYTSFFFCKDTVYTSQQENRHSKEHNLSKKQVATLNGYTRYITGIVFSVHGIGKQQTWVNLLEIKQCSYTIFVFLLKFSHAIENNLGVVRGKHTT
jgi:hypothetical protein